MEPMSPALAGGFPPTVPAGKSSSSFFFLFSFSINLCAAVKRGKKEVLLQKLPGTAGL